MDGGPKHRKHDGEVAKALNSMSRANLGEIAELESVVAEFFLPHDSDFELDSDDSDCEAAGCEASSGMDEDCDCTLFTNTDVLYDDPPVLDTNVDLERLIAEDYCNNSPDLEWEKASKFR